MPVTVAMIAQRLRDDHHVEVSSPRYGVTSQPLSPSNAPKTG